MRRATRLFLSVWSLSLLFSLTCCSQLPKGRNEARTESENTNRTQEALRTLKEYFALEQSQEYRKIYELLSSNFKAELVKESGVKNAEDYEKLRRSSEAKWCQFSVKGEQIESKERITFIVSTQVEEAGETEQTPAKYSLVFREGKWLIDSWQY